MTSQSSWNNLGSTRTSPNLNAKKNWWRCHEKWGKSSEDMLRDLFRVFFQEYHFLHKFSESKSGISILFDSPQKDTNFKALTFVVLLPWSSPKKNRQNGEKLTCFDLSTWGQNAKTMKLSFLVRSEWHLWVLCVRDPQKKLKQKKKRFLDILGFAKSQR